MPSCTFSDTAKLMGQAPCPTPLNAESANKCSFMSTPERPRSTDWQTRPPYLEMGLVCLINISVKIAAPCGGNIWIRRVTK